MGERNIAYYQNVWDDASLVYPVTADPEHHVEAVVGRTVRQLREEMRYTASEDEVEIANRRLFGAGSNANFMTMVYKQNPLYRELIIENAHCGVFDRQLNHRNVPKMIQLITFIRLRMYGITGNNSEVFSAVHAISIAEIMGYALPENYLKTTAESQQIIIRVARHIMTNPDDIVGFDGHESWFDENIIGYTQAELLAVADINVAMVIIEGVASSLTSNQLWLTGVSLVTTGIVSMARKGLITQDSQEKLVTSLKSTLGQTAIFIPILSVEHYYSKYGILITADNAEVLFGHFGRIIANDLIVIRNLITFASGTGLTAYITCIRALARFPDFPWGSLSLMIQGDFTALNTAITTVNQNLYFGFNQNVGVASGKRFPTLLYVCIDLVTKLDGENSLKNYAGRPQRVPSKAAVDVVIAEYIARKATGIPENVNLSQETIDSMNALRNHAIRLEAAFNAQ